MGRLLRYALPSVALACGGGDPISGTWRSEAFPDAHLVLDEQREGTLTLGERVYEARAEPTGQYRYGLERCGFAPEGIEPHCTLHTCEFVEEDDPDDELDDGPDLSVLRCRLDGGWRSLFAD